MTATTIPDRYINGNVQRRVDQLRIGDRVDLQDDPIADRSDCAKFAAYSVTFAPTQLLTDITVFRDPVTGKPKDPATFPQGAVSAKRLVAWGESIGVYADVWEDEHGIQLAQIDRDEQVAKGRGAEFMRGLCAYADCRGKPVYLTVTGWNDTLETYYAQFGFVEDDRQGRDEETGDVLMVRVNSR